jgi:hypothetical protein
MVFLLSGLWIVLLFYWVEHENIILSGLNIILYILFLNFIAKMSIMDSFLEHPGRSFIVALGYLSAGFAWSFVKWWLFVNRQAIGYKEKRYEWLMQQKNTRERRGVSLEGIGEVTLETMVPENLKNDWLSKIGYGYARPKAVEHKKTISHWIIYWPVSALWSLLDDFIGKVVRVIVVKFRFIYEKITMNAFKNIEDIK